MSEADTRKIEGEPDKIGHPYLESVAGVTIDRENKKAIIENPTAMSLVMAADLFFSLRPREEHPNQSMLTASIALSMLEDLDPQVPVEMEYLEGSIDEHGCISLSEGRKAEWGKTILSFRQGGNPIGQSVVEYAFRSREAMIAYLDQAAPGSVVKRGVTSGIAPVDAPPTEDEGRMNAMAMPGDNGEWQFNDLSHNAAGIVHGAVTGAISSRGVEWKKGTTLMIDYLRPAEARSPFFLAESDERGMIIQKQRPVTTSRLRHDSPGMTAIDRGRNQMTETLLGARIDFEEKAMAQERKEDTEEIVPILRCTFTPTADHKEVQSMAGALIDLVFGASSQYRLTRLGRAEKLTISTTKIDFTHIKPLERGKPITIEEESWPTWKPDNNDPKTGASSLVCMQEGSLVAKARVEYGFIDSDRLQRILERRLGIKFQPEIASIYKDSHRLGRAKSDENVHHVLGIEHATSAPFEDATFRPSPASFNYKGSIHGSNILLFGLAGVTGYEGYEIEYPSPALVQGFDENNRSMNVFRRRRNAGNPALIEIYQEETDRIVATILLKNYKAPDDVSLSLESTDNAVGAVLTPHSRTGT